MKSRIVIINSVNIIMMFIVCIALLFLSGCGNESKDAQADLLENDYHIASLGENEKVLLILTNEEIDGAEITVENLSDKTAEIVYPEYNGYGYMAMLEEGFYQATFSCDGYVTDSKLVSIGEENSLYVLGLNIEEIMEMDKSNDEETISSNEETKGSIEEETEGEGLSIIILD